MVEAVSAVIGAVFCCKVLCRPPKKHSTSDVSTSRPSAASFLVKKTVILKIIQSLHGESRSRPSLVASSEENKGFGYREFGLLISGDNYSVGRKSNLMYKNNMFIIQFAILLLHNVIKCVLW